jgi:hypothetical protein
VLLRWGLILFFILLASITIMQLILAGAGQMFFDPQRNMWGQVEGEKIFSISSLFS